MPFSSRPLSLLIGRRMQLTQLAAFHRLPATYSLREMAEAGGLMSYGTNIGDEFHQVGVYAGRILGPAVHDRLPSRPRHSHCPSGPGGMPADMPRRASSETLHRTELMHRSK